MSNIIDISSNQGAINLRALDFDGVIIKATQGTTYENEFYNGQSGQMEFDDKLAGAYHYLDGSGAREEAKFFVSKIKNWQGKHIWAADWESSGAGTDGYNPEFEAGNTQYLLDFLDEVTFQLGYKGCVYTSISAVRSQDFDRIASLGYALWFAQYANNDPTGWQDNPWSDGQGTAPFPTNQVWGQQYTSNLRLAGYDGPLDGSLFTLDEEHWNDAATGSIDKPTEDNNTPESSSKIDEDPCLGLGLAGLMQVVSHTYAPKKGLT